MRFARVILVAALVCMSMANAGWFSSDEEDESPSERRRRRRGEQQEDTVEQYRPPYGDRDEEPDRRRDARQPRGPREPRETEEVERYSGRDGGRARREHLKDMRAKDRDEMMSQEYNRRVADDDEVEETHTPEENLDGYLSDEEINKLWAEHMHDFVPEDMLNFVVEKKSTEALFEEINHAEPTLVRGAYYVLGGNKDKVVTCIIYDPNREVVYKRKGSAQGILLFNTTIPGEYALIFSSTNAKQDLTVTLALHTYDEEKEEAIKYDITADGQRFEVKPRTQEEVKAEVLGGEENWAATEEEIGSVRAKLRDIQVAVKQIQTEAKLSMLRQNGHNEDLLVNQDWNFYFMLVEVACFCGIVAFQTHHIKKLLDNKLIM